MIWYNKIQNKQTTTLKFIVYMCTEPFENVYKDEFAKSILVESAEKDAQDCQVKWKLETAYIRVQIKLKHWYIVSYNMTM